MNGLADFGVKIEPIRKGGTKRGLVTGFRVSWWRKDIPELRAAYTELKRVKGGRIARLRGKSEVVAATNPALAAAADAELAAKLEERQPKG